MIHLETDNKPVKCPRAVLLRKPMQQTQLNLRYQLSMFCQTQKRRSVERRASGNHWPEKWTLDRVRINCPKEEKRGNLRRDNWSGSEICYYKRAEQKLGRQANGRDATHRQQNHKVGEGCGHGQWHVQSGVYEIWKWTVQTFKADIQKWWTKQQISVRLRGHLAVASWLVVRKGEIVRNHCDLELNKRTSQTN